MPNGINLASKFSPIVDERFTRESQAMLALNNDYEFTGVDTVKVYSLPVVPMGNYNRTASANRYGTASNLTRNVQTLQIQQDRSFTFIIDKADKLQSQMVTDAGKALSRQTNEVVIPEFDTYVFKTLSDAAINAGQSSTTAVSTSNAYSEFLAANEAMGNANVPDKGRVAFCSYGYANMLKQDPAFMKYGDQSQEMLIKGVIGEVDGCKIVKVPSSRLPAGTAFLLVHPSAATAPKQLEDYRIHDDPPGINGWLVEGRILYDAFVLNSKAKAVFWHGGVSTLRALQFVTAATATGESTIIMINPTEPIASGNFRYAVSATFAGLPSATAADLSNYTAFTAAGPSQVLDSTALSGITSGFVRVIETDSSNNILSVGDAVLNIG